MKHLFVLKYSGFRYYLFAKFVSSLGDWFQTLAFPFAIYQLTGSGFSVALALALQSIPYIIVAPFAGILADQKSRKNIMIISDLIRGAVLIIIWCIGIKNTIILYAMAIILSTMSAFFSPAATSLLPTLINEEKNDLTAANAIDSLVSNCTMLIGPLIGGILLTSVGVAYGFLINGVSFLIAGLLLCNLTSDKRQPVNDKAPSSKIDLIKELVPYLNDNTVLSKLIFTGVLVSIGGSAFIALEAVLIQSVLHGTPGDYGIITSAWGVGMLVATLSLIIISKMKDVAVYLLGILLLGIATIGYGFSTTVIVAAAWNIVGGFANSLFVITNRSLIQQFTVEEKRGRVFALRGVISQAITPLTMGICGALSDIIGVSRVFQYIGFMVVLVAVLGKYWFAQEFNKTSSRRTYVN